ncbi:MAG TPA: hypothetical protein VF554_11300 [Thermoanaerobaculia bacterium]
MTWSARVILGTLILVRFRASAQSPVEHIAFDRPEAWALKYFTAVSTFTPLGAPRAREAGAVELGFEGGWVPQLSESQRRVGFDGTALEDLNKTPVFGRARLLVGLPAGFSAEVGWVPPVALGGGRANLIDVALDRPFFDGTGGGLGVRLYGQVGHGKGDFTCSKDVVAQSPGSAGNPQGCNELSRDTSTLNNVGAVLTGGLKLGVAALHFAAGATYNDLQFQTGAVTNGTPDDTVLATHGWTGWATAGASLSIGARASIAAEAYYSPLLVKRAPGLDSRNDGLFNVRAMLRYVLR